MKKLITVILITLFTTVTIAQTNPCQDKLYMELQKKNLDSLTERQYAYYIEKTKQCNEYIKFLKKLETQKEIEAQPDNAGTIVGIVFGGLIVLGLISLMASNNK